ncbi:MAG: aromatic ring-hydroxylating dioxygenase subunit alpha [Dehalococcoidia bacterium]|nr:aromatic ring-hydroxylating dioxygenase subunit alpha [Dehalococcoidia bacterium]
MVTTPLTPRVNTAKGLVDRTIFSNQEIYQQELEQVFGRCWMWLGHESQIPNNNDFTATYIGEDPILLTRDSKGKLHAFLNMCRHRGNRICRADEGNAPSFMCTYHGWTFATDGKLVGVPGYKEAYFEELDRSQWGLVETAHIGSYKGLVFGTWDKNAPTLEDYLGDSAWYLDLLVDRREGGSELIGGVHRWVMDFNWKFGSDNFGGDNYHVPISHGSIGLAGMNRNPRGAGMAEQGKDRFTVYAGNGHCITSGGSTAAVNPQMLNSAPQAGQEGNEYLRSYPDELKARLGEVRARQQALGIGTIFPNFTWHSSPTVRIWHPRGPFKTEIWSYCLVDKKAPAEIKNIMKRNYIMRFGPAGTMEQDDANNWSQSTTIGKSPRAQKVQLNMQMGIGHEFTNETHPGVLGHAVSETNWRGFYGWYAKMMDAPSWGSVKLDPKTTNKW